MAKYLDPVTGEFTDPTGGETWTPQPEPIGGGNPTGDPLTPPKSGVGSPETPQFGGGDQTGIGQINGPTETGGQPSSPLAGQPGDGPGTPQRIDTSGEGGGGTIPSDVLLHQPLPDAQASQGYANITGLDTNKLNDPNKNDVKYDAHSRAFSKAVGATNAGNADPALSPTDPGSLAKVIANLQQNGFPNAKQVGTDKIDYGDGTVVDVLLNGGQGGWGWLPQSGAEADANNGLTGGQGLVQGATRGASAASASAGHPAPPPGYDYDNGGNLVDAFGHPAPAGVGGGGSQGVAPSGTSSPYADQIRQRIMARLDELGKPVDENDPQIASAVTAARDEATRAQGTERTALAEHLYGQGGGGLQSNAITQGIQQSAERNATGIGTLRAKLIQQQYTMKQAQLQQLLTTALQSGDSESARQVQLQMAALDAELRRQGMGIQLAEFGAGLNQNAAIYGLNG